MLEEIASGENKKKPTEFPLPGFFEHTNFDEVKVGETVFKVPSVVDIQTRHRAVHDSPSENAAVRAHRYLHGTDFADGTKNIIDWVERGKKELAYADRLRCLSLHDIMLK